MDIDAEAYARNTLFSRKSYIAVLETENNTAAARRTAMKLKNWILPLYEFEFKYLKNIYFIHKTDVFSL